MCTHSLLGSVWRRRRRRRKGAPLSDQITKKEGDEEKKKKTDKDLAYNEMVLTAAAPLLPCTTFLGVHRRSPSTVQTGSMEAILLLLLLAVVPLQYFFTVPQLAMSYEPCFLYYYYYYYVRRASEESVEQSNS